MPCWETRQGIAWWPRLHELQMSHSDPSAPKPNLNFRLYGIARSTLHGFLRRLPAALVPPHASPRVPITVAVNGFGDITAQRRNLQLLEAELCAPAPAPTSPTTTTSPPPPPSMRTPAVCGASPPRPIRPISTRAGRNAALRRVWRSASSEAMGNPSTLP
jgi:hypothetical protein